MAKTNYESRVLPRMEEITAWAKHGLSEKQIAGNLGIGYASLRRYKAREKGFAAALAQAKEVPDREVENALFRRALGYNAQVLKHYKLKRVEYNEETGRKMSETEELVAARDEVHILPDLDAQKFWLANRQPGHWCYKPESGADAEEGRSGVIVIPQVSAEEGAEEGAGEAPETEEP